MSPWQRRGLELRISRTRRKEANEDGDVIISCV